jgi:hypothetical protein
VVPSLLRSTVKRQLQRKGYLQSYGELPRSGKALSRTDGLGERRYGITSDQSGEQRRRGRLSGVRGLEAEVGPRWTGSTDSATGAQRWIGVTSGDGITLQRPAGLHPALTLAYDKSLARRAAAVAVVAALVTLLVVAATDAGGPWPPRLGMTAALAPLCGALGALAAVRVAAARGELRALAASGAEPARAVRGAVAGGIAVGLLGPLVAASGVADLGSLFPRALDARRWIADGADLHELTLGLRVGPRGELALEAPRAAVGALPGGATAFTIVALGVAALACPAWTAAVAESPARRVAVGGAAVGAAIVAFQGVAAGRLPAAALTVAPLLLLTDTVIARYRARSRG